MCERCNELQGVIDDLFEKILAESLNRGIYEGKTYSLEKQVIYQQSLITTLLNMINKEK